MIKKSLMIFIGIIVLLSNIAFANTSTDKVLIKYYWGIGCSHCEEIEPFIEKISLKYQDKINLQKYEVFQDNKNFQQLINDCKLINPNINTNRLGTPTIIINNKILMRLVCKILPLKLQSALFSRKDILEFYNLNIILF